MREFMCNPTARVNDWTVQNLFERLGLREFSHNNWLICWIVNSCESQIYVCMYGIKPQILATNNIPIFCIGGCK